MVSLFFIWAAFGWLLTSLLLSPLEAHDPWVTLGMIVVAGVFRIIEINKNNKK